MCSNNEHWLKLKNTKKIATHSRGTPHAPHGPRHDAKKQFPGRPSNYGVQLLNTLGIT